MNIIIITKEQVNVNKKAQQKYTKSYAIHQLFIHVNIFTSFLKLFDIQQKCIYAI